MIKGKEMCVLVSNGKHVTNKKKIITLSVMWFTEFLFFVLIYL